MGRGKTIVIAGSGRSGTTFLRRCFDEHPALWTHPRSEIQFFGHPRYTFGLVGMQYEGDSGRVDPELLKGTCGRALDRLLGKSGHSALDRYGEAALRKSVRAFGEEISKKAIPPDEIWDRIGRWMWGLFVPSNCKKIWLQKTPWDCHYFDKLDQCFPNSKFVHIVRDPRDVIDSAMAKRWGGRTIVHAIGWYRLWAERWQQAELRGVTRMPNYHEVRYERLVRDPAVWKKLLDFLEIKPLPRPDFKPVHQGRHKKWNDNQRREYRQMLTIYPWVERWHANK